MPNLKQAAISYILIALQDPNLGIKQDRKDFLSIKPKPGDKLDKVMSSQLCTVNYYMIIYLIGNKSQWREAISLCVSIFEKLF